MIAYSARAVDTLLFNMDEIPLFLIQSLLARLERISTDSVCAHRASGIRGSLLRLLERIEAGLPVSRTKLEALISSGFHILEESAKGVSHRRIIGNG